MYLFEHLLFIFKCYKRKNEENDESSDSNNYNNYESSNKEEETHSNPFRSAKEQFLIDKTKCNSNNNNNNGSSNGYSYNPANAVKKSLGTTNK